MPPKHSRQGPQAALSDGLPTYNQHNPRPKVRIELLGEGCILWLPDRNENETRKIICIRDSCCFGNELTNEGYNHPVLVLKIKQDRMCSFAQVTSKQQNRRVRRINRLPISHYPTTDLDETISEALHLEEGSMNRQSYVKTEHIFDVDITQLRTYGFSTKSKPSDIRLKRQSYEYLAQKLGLQEYGRWVPTKLLIHGFGGYKPPLSQALPIQPRRNTNPSIDNRTNSAPHLNARKPLLDANDIPYWQMDRTIWNSVRQDSTRRQRECNDIAWRYLEANRRGPPSTDGTGSLLGLFGCVLGFAGFVIIGHLAASALLERFGHILGLAAFVIIGYLATDNRWELFGYLIGFIRFVIIGDLVANTL